MSRRTQTPVPKELDVWLRECTLIKPVTVGGRMRRLRFLHTHFLASLQSVTHNFECSRWQSWMITVWLLIALRMLFVITHCWCNAGQSR